MKGTTMLFLRYVGAFALLCLLLSGGCQSLVSQLKPALEEEGEVLLYAQPFPQEAGRLRFKIDGMWARRNDGAEYPLSLKLSEMKGMEMVRQRFLGSVQLPVGSYAGLSIKVSRAFLTTEDGEATLLTPDAAVKIDFPFSVSRKKAQVFVLIFRSAESLGSGYAFNPSFWVAVPARPVVALTGYVTNYGDNNITVFDKKSGEVTGVIAVGTGPAGMALDQRNGKLFVAASESDAIEVIDVAAGDVIDRIRLNFGDHPQELALAPDGRTLLCVNIGSNTVSIVEAGSRMESARITVGNGPHSVLTDPLGRRAYVFNGLSSTISVIDIANKALVTTIATDPGPLRGQFNRRGDRFYVIHEWSPYLSVFDPSSLSLVRRTQVGTGMTSIKVDTNSDLIYLGKARDPVVAAYDPFSFSPVDYIQTGGGIVHATIDGDGNNLVMVNADAQQILTKSLIGKRTLSVIDVGARPYWVSLMGER